MNRRRLRSFILIFTPLLGIGLHQGLFAKWGVAARGENNT
jgi:hypothetical protein